MTRFLIKSARDIIVVSWVALIIAAYLAIGEANRLGDALSISDEARYALIGTALVIAVIYTGLCGASLVMFGIHDRLSEISASFALVADRLCNDERTRATRPELVADPAAPGSIVEPHSSDSAIVSRHVDPDGESQPLSYKKSWWSDASSEKRLP